MLDGEDKSEPVSEPPFAVEKQPAKLNQPKTIEIVDFDELLGRRELPLRRFKDTERGNNICLTADSDGRLFLSFTMNSPGILISTWYSKRDSEYIHRPEVSIEIGKTPEEEISEAKGMVFYKQGKPFSLIGLGSLGQKRSEDDRFGVTIDEHLRNESVEEFLQALGISQDDLLQFEDAVEDWQKKAEKIAEFYLAGKFFKITNRHSQSSIGKPIDEPIIQRSSRMIRTRLREGISDSKKKDPGKVERILKARSIALLARYLQKLKDSDWEGVVLSYNAEKLYYDDSVEETIRIDKEGIGFVYHSTDNFFSYGLRKKPNNLNNRPIDSQTISQAWLIKAILLNRFTRYERGGIMAPIIELHEAIVKPG